MSNYKVLNNLANDLRSFEWTNRNGTLFDRSYNSRAVEKKNKKTGPI